MSIDLEYLEKLALEATPGPWVAGDVWHVQGASHCTCRPHYGPLVREQRMNINGTMMLAHVHRSEKPWHDPVITTEPEKDGHPRYVVTTTDEYGAIDNSDRDFIAATDPQTVLALVARIREAEARIEKVVRLRDRMEQQRDDIDESVRLSTILVDLNAALTEGDEQ